MRIGPLLGAALLALGFAAGAVADECDPNDPTLLKPDLVAEPPSHVHVADQSGHRFVLFATTIENVGRGPLVLEARTVDDPNDPTGPQVTEVNQIVNRTDGTTCTHLAGYFPFDPGDHHWHFDDFADYQVRKGDVEHTSDPLTEPVVAQADKVSFCVTDMKRLRGFRTRTTVASNCNVPEGIQGLDAGYADVYDGSLPGQIIDLDADPAHPLPAGNYFLVNTVNPRGVILEVNDNLEANSGVVSIVLPPPSGRRRHASRDSRPGHPAHHSHPLHPSRTR